jgi:hypothetical protein
LHRFVQQIVVRVEAIGEDATAAQCEGGGQAKR